MYLSRFIRRVVPAVLLALAGCGQTGALYLPDTGVETPVEIKAPATPAPEPAPAPEPDDKDKKADQPQGR
jgi:predicted small lipoprotein YifL